MSTQAHLLTIGNSDIIKQVEGRTFKIGKAHEAVAGDKLTSDIKLTDLGYERSMVYGWIDQAVGNITAWFSRYAEDSIASGTGDDKRHMVTFHMPSSWPKANGDGFNASCREYVICFVIYKFLRLSLPKEAEFYLEEMKAARSDAERSLFAKNGGASCQ